ncbi:hypothetical protein A1O3_09110 [Capronia epimyces CBS 606.96]|uniref:Uncharacterized protein n=1 Tax=Capronia epimyces CBS 606.96 TaxID=1182542 RepID=W9XLV8_9EURO|nr:uncharacterized protein A1O3_09110 [Capronia epimyces CBS 606.96]EXJ77951.1 hypothetical protein A1O3_09110 [Capronia epimyces CBS 606.96]
MSPREAANRPTRHTVAGLDEDLPAPSLSKEPSAVVKRKGQRTLRACDFCRLKKAKVGSPAGNVQLWNPNPPTRETELTA